ncbi:MAG: hypothetical protein JRF63_00470 [Deltaproteobacteria bacterium]|nr:hypothetical protein [Deltaproteobacteria bacterium]
MQATSRHLIVAIVAASMFLFGWAGCDNDRRIEDEGSGTADYEGSVEEAGLLFGFTSLGSYTNTSGGVFVTAVAESGESSTQSVESDDAGYFELELDPGSYDVYASGSMTSGFGVADCGDVVLGVLIDADEGVQLDLHLICDDLD